MTIYFEITDVVYHALRNSTVTGIQRGVVRIIAEFLKDGHGAAGLIKHPISGQFRAVDLSFLAGGYNFSTGDFLSRFEMCDARQIWFAGKLLKFRNRLFMRTFRQLLCLAQWGLSTSVRKKAKANILVPKGKSCLKDLSLNQQDCIVTLGAGWMTDYVGVHKLAAACGCKTVTFIHDIIPLTHFWFNGKAEKDKNFEKWLKYCLINDDRIICNSYFTQGELATQLSKWGLKQRILVTQYPHEFQSCRASSPSDTAQPAIPGKYVLCVGTITLRKNTQRLIETWKRVEDELGDDAPTLVLAGAKGRYPGISGLNIRRVVFIERPDDAMLEGLYKGCLFTVFPSLFEGWGLPIGESLWFGKPVLCANAASMPEAGGRYADYFDPTNSESLYEGIMRLIRRPKRFPESIRSELRTWKDTAETLRLQLEGILHESSNLMLTSTAPVARGG